MIEESMSPDLAACITSQGEKEKKRKRLESTESLRAQPQQSKDVCKGSVSHWCHFRAKDFFFLHMIFRETRFYSNSNSGCYPNRHLYHVYVPPGYILDVLHSIALMMFISALF